MPGAPNRSPSASRHVPMCVRVYHGSEISHENSSCPPPAACLRVFWCEWSASSVTYPVRNSFIAAGSRSLRHLAVRSARPSSKAGDCTRIDPPSEHQFKFTHAWVSPDVKRFTATCTLPVHYLTRCCSGPTVEHTVRSAFPAGNSPGHDIPGHSGR